jgi:DNA-binding response OmpR family regulator
MMSPVVPEILLVDGDEAVRGTLAASLRQHGFAVREAAGAARALALYRRGHRGIAVVVLAAEPDGPRTLAALREINPTVRCGFLSADGDAAEELLGQGAVFVVPKPLPCLGQVSAFVWAASLAGGCLRGQAGRPARGPARSESTPGA